MNKKVKVALIIGFILATSYNVLNSQKTEGVSDLVMANIEALAWPEGLPGPEIRCPTPSTTYGNCRELKINYYPYPHASCVMTSNTSSVCTYSLEAEANRYL